MRGRREGVEKGSEKMRRKEGGDTYHISEFMVDVLKEAVSLGEGGAAVLHQVERFEVPK